jgi:hypothetical protein
MLTVSLHSSFNKLVYAYVADVDNDRALAAGKAQTRLKAKLISVDHIDKLTTKRTVYYSITNAMLLTLQPVSITGFMQDQGRGQPNRHQYIGTILHVRN